MATNKADVDKDILGASKIIVEEKPRIPFPSCRLILSVLSFIGFFVVYCLRVNLSVAIVAMVNATYVKEVEELEAKDRGNTTGNDVLDEEDFCEGENKSKTHKDPGVNIYNWDAKQQGIVLGSFFYGYLVTQIAGGMLSEMFGGKFLFLFGVFCTSALTVLTPPITYAGGFGAIVATRIVEGIGEGVTFPAMHAMLARWAPPLDRSKMVTFIYAGSQMGTVLTMPVSGVLCEYVSWESVFYITGAIGVIWSFLWLFFVFDSPSTHPRISPQERSYIETSIGPHKKGSLSLPWLEIVKSPPVYAVIVAHFTHNWGYYTMLTCLPQYLSAILKFDIKSNGGVAGIPYLVLWGAMVGTGLTADYIRKRQLLSTTMVRKLCNAIGFIGGAAFLVGTGYVHCNAALAVALIVIAVGVSGISWGGWSVNHLDLAPPYAGTLMGITNTVATIPGFVGPAVVKALAHKPTRKAWRTVFYISAGVYILGTIFYFIFGSGERQKWAIEPTATVEAKAVQSPTAQIEAKAVPGPTTQIAANAVPGTTAQIEAKTVPGPTAQIAASAVPRPSAPIAASAVPRPSAQIEAKAVPGPTAQIAASAVPRPSAQIEAKAVPGPTAQIAANAVPRPSAPIAASAVPRPSAPIAASAVPRPSAQVEAKAVPGPTAQIAASAVPRPSAPIAASAVPRPSAQVEAKAVPGPTAQIAASAVPRPTAQNEAKAVPGPTAQIAANAVLDPTAKV